MRYAWVASVLALTAAAGGCEKPLFPGNLPRTQFERYDRLRGNYAPAERFDRFGATQPALRERLTPPS